LCHGANSESPLLQCVLTGDWINDLGSTMTIGKVNEEGSFSGTFFTAVGDASNPIEPSPLLGYQKLINQPTFGFTMSWSCSDSILVYVGQCFVDDRGQEVLRTMWFLRSHADDINDNWKATR
ncbi:AVID protein, partial [Trogon melanurus]|nr:AVID protein [Trogon melanurus]